MARCDLTVRLDDDAAVFRPGDVIHGEVVVRVHAAGACDGLTLVCEWFTRGAGNVEQGEASVEQLFVGDWRPGEHRYRFAVVAPRGPLAYESPQLTVGWRLVARADLPWARDSSAAAEFRLLPRREGSLEDPYYFGPGYTALVAGIEPSPTVSLTPTGQPVRDRTPWWTLLLAILMMFALLYTLPALLVIAALCVGYALIRALLVRARLGSPELRVVPRVSCPEGVVEVTLAIKPRKDVQLAECFVELRAVLTVEKGQGKGRRTTTKALFERREQLALVGRQLRAGQRVEGAVAFAIPAEGPYTFIASSNKIRWIVAARAGISWWPAWREECELSVRPGQAPGAAYRRPSA